MAIETEAPKGAPQKSYRAILAEEISAGLTELNRSASGLFISAVSAGLDVGFSLLAMAVVLTLTAQTLSSPLTEILVANAYTIGFIFVVLGRSELFTEHTTLAVLPVLSRRTSLLSLLRLWGIVYAGNLVGTAVFAWFAVSVGPDLGVIQPWAFGELAGRLVRDSGISILKSAVLAGWLMGLLSWLVTAARDTISQIAIIWLITATIGLGHLPHCIAGSTEVLAALIAGQGGSSIPDFLHFLLWTTLGNAVGGVFFVAIIKHTHAVRSGAKH
jgi:formate/nitrite transporter FocA (FNT family)